MFFFRSLSHLIELLQSPHLEVRMSAGDAIVLIFELGREYSADFQEDFTPDLCDMLRGLATDSHKYRAKKDRKQQRASFRDILHFIEVNILFLLPRIEAYVIVIISEVWVRKPIWASSIEHLGIQKV